MPSRQRPPRSLRPALYAASVLCCGARSERAGERCAPLVCLTHTAKGGVDPISTAGLCRVSVSELSDCAGWCRYASSRAIVRSPQPLSAMWVVAPQRGSLGSGVLLCDARRRTHTKARCRTRFECHEHDDHGPMAHGTRHAACAPPPVGHAARCRADGDSSE
eukprot:scaffold63618_cov63-Phaeocystis_antarctica.AAC.1